MTFGCLIDVLAGESLVVGENYGNVSSCPWRFTRHRKLINEQPCLTSVSVNTLLDRTISMIEILNEHT